MILALPESSFRASESSVAATPPTHCLIFAFFLSIFTDTTITHSFGLSFVGRLGQSTRCWNKELEAGTTLYNIVDVTEVLIEAFLGCLEHFPPST